MVRPRTSPEATPILQLLSDYSFDVDTYAAEVMVTDWLQRFEPTWVSQAITEALYQGRYKLVSVDHILQIWQRRGQPLRHFNREFESIILGQSFNQIPAPAKPSPAPLNFSQEPITQDDPPQIVSPNSPGPAGNSTWTTPTLPSALAPSDSSALPSSSTPPWEPASWVAASVTSAFTPSVSAMDETETASSSWPSSRTIPPLTPDQLARLTQPSSKAAPVKPEDAATVDLSPISHSLGLTVQESPDGASLDGASPNVEPSDMEPSDVEPSDVESPAVEPSPLAKAGTSAFNPVAPSTTVLEDETTSEDETISLPKGQTKPDLPTEPIPNFQPITSPAGLPPEPMDTIPPFVPAAGSSGLHQRLKAVVEAGLTEN